MLVYQGVVMETSSSSSVQKHIRRLPRDTLVELILSGDFRKHVDDPVLVNYFDKINEEAKLKRIRVRCLNEELIQDGGEINLDTHSRAVENKLKEYMDKLNELETILKGTPEGVPEAVEESSISSSERHFMQLGKQTLVELILFRDRREDVQDPILRRYFDNVRQLEELKRSSVNMKVDYLTAKLLYCHQKPKLEKHLSLIATSLEENMGKLSELEDYITKQQTQDGASSGVDGSFIFIVKDRLRRLPKDLLQQISLNGDIPDYVDDRVLRNYSAIKKQVAKLKQENDYIRAEFLSAKLACYHGRLRLERLLSELENKMEENTDTLRKLEENMKE